MKKLIFAFAVLFALQASAQSEKFVAAMKANLAAMDTSFRNPQNLLTVGNNFERIANAEKNQWLPYYYAALCQINYVFVAQKSAEGDAFADKADALLAKADELSPKNSEISLLHAMNTTVRMLVNPMERYMKYGMEVEGFVQSAIALDQTNPRPYAFKASMLKNTPEQFGGGCGAASSYFKDAAERFEKFVPANDISPKWGKERNAMLMKECGF